MSIKAVAVILAPSEAVPHGSDLAALVTDEDGSEELARQHLMDNFAKTVLGDSFPKLDRTDTWNLWQLAEKNGFRIQVASNVVDILGTGRPAQ